MSIYTSIGSVKKLSQVFITGKQALLAEYHPEEPSLYNQVAELDEIAKWKEKLRLRDLELSRRGCATEEQRNSVKGLEKDLNLNPFQLDKTGTEFVERLSEMNALRDRNRIISGHVVFVQGLHTSAGERIQELNDTIDAIEPLFSISVKVRLGAIETTKKAFNKHQPFQSLYVADIEAIAARNVAAHEGDIEAHNSPYRLDTLNAGQERRLS
ncbi:hypothetical protein BJ875DRAFT_484975 [Amylocarpus encephaloides]|uniref:Uncharacterized protein n=1 Tax=Amylocarpus encephaloides TaxID=45428 RepID=A0A9P8C4G3_9HELO|nr:hypothetical protein BJ875DRAFT_484975 [Amylocarpus encephaloides]